MFVYIFPLRTMPARLPLEEKGHSQSIHVRNVLWNKYVVCFSGKPGDSASNDLSRYIERFLLEREGKANKPQFDYEDAVREKTKALKDEQQQQKLLESLPSKDNEGNAFEVIWDFTKDHLGITFDNGSTTLEILQELRQKLALYECTGKESFDQSSKLIFIHYLDFKLKRKNLEAQLAKFLKENPDPTLLMVDSS